MSAVICNNFPQSQVFMKIVIPFSCCINHFCVQVLREAIDEMGGTSHEPTSRRITVEAEPVATEKLKYNVPVSGTEKDDRSFLIECDLPGFFCTLPWKKHVMINNNQCLTFSLPVLTAASTSETIGHVTVTSTSGISPGKPIITDTLSIVVNMFTISNYINNSIIRNIFSSNNGCGKLE